MTENSKSNDPFLEIFLHPHTCDYCMKKNRHIFNIILIPRYEINNASEKEITMSIHSYMVEKKCRKCVENKK